MFAKILDRYRNSSMRSKDALINIIISLGTKGISILTSLLVVPITINYVNPTEYGIWLTFSSVIAWVYFFDFGLGNGFRNKFAEAKAAGNIPLARQYVSTTYFAISAIVVVLLALLLFANAYVDWTKVLNLEAVYAPELQKVFGIICLFFCMNMVVNIFTMLVTADQKPAIASIVQTSGSVVSLAVIYILTKFTAGDLTKLAFVFAGVPCLVMLVTSVYMFCFTRYKQVAPRIADIRPSLIRNILSLGVKFFVIYLCLLAIFQVINVVISREFGAYAVTQYNIAYKYFNVLYMVLTIILTPFWSAATDAYVRKDYAWIKSMIRKLEYCWLGAVAGGILMVILSPWFFQIWIGDSVEVSWGLSVSALVYMLCMTFGSIYMYVINGIGTIHIQLIAYVVLAIVAWPMFVLGGKYFGLPGVLLLPSLAWFIQGVLGKIQLNKLLNGIANGLWAK